MKALANILAEAAFQCRIRGDLGARLWCLAVFYYHYGAGRAQGLPQGESRLQAIKTLARLGFLERYVTVSWPSGMSLRTNVFSACFMLKEFAADGMYQKAGFPPRPGETVVDVGAHHGLFTLMAASRMGSSGRIVAIEASPDNLEVLEGNVKANKLDLAKIVGQAASDAPGQVDFHISPIDTAGSVVYKREGSRTISVPMDTLDNILQKAGIDKVDLVKIDVEGFCLSVLKGAAKTLAQGPRLVMEVEGGEEEVDKVRRFVEGAGYHVDLEDGILYAGKR